ncbi:MAG: prepilin peptidase [Candidatus Omnitrophica bacterium]|nr:prepilin peptidase [Candidatus Omnitrophota bacterium]
MPEILSRILVFILGSCVGSFLNVCIHRLPKDISIIKPRSFCPHCKQMIRWYDNIPILSYLILKGKCRACNAAISLRYPFVELVTAVIFLVLYAHFGLCWNLIKYLFFFCFLIVVSFIDIDYHAIPAYLCFVAIAVGLFFDIRATIVYLKAGMPLDFKFLPIFRAFRALLFGLGFTYLFKLFGDIFINIYLALRKKESIEGEKESLGLGDVDFMGVVGIFLGIKAVIFVFFLAPFFALLYSVVAMVFKKSHLIPYLPYLSLASVAMFFWGNHIVRFIGIVF